MALPLRIISFEELNKRNLEKIGDLKISISGSEKDFERFIRRMRKCTYQSATVVIIEPEGKIGDYKQILKEGITYNGIAHFYTD